jgi:hypothetical protein
MNNNQIDERSLGVAPRHGADLWGRHYHGGQFFPFYIPRDLMPQVDDTSEMLRFLRQHGAITRHEEVNPRSIFPHQRVDASLIPALTNNRALLKKPVLVSGDDYILDGHHRWDAHIVRNDATMPIVRIANLTFEQAVDLMFQDKHTYTYGQERAA